MSYLAKVGSFNIDTSKTVGQTQSISGIGFQPKIVLFWWGGSTATGDSVAGGTISYGFGAAISSSSRFCVSTMSEDAQADSDVRYSQQTTEVIRAYTDSATIDGIADFDSMTADGFDLMIDDQFTQAYRISYLALGGDDLTNVYIGNYAMHTVVEQYNVTGVGFQSDAVIIASTEALAASSAGNTEVLKLGWATGASAQGCIKVRGSDAQATSNTSGYGFNGEVNSGGNSSRDAFVAFIADGFTLNHLEGTEASYQHYICLKGGQYLVGELTTRTDGNDISETVGFQPVALLFGSVNRALSTQDANSNHARLSIGAGTGASERACAAISDEHGLADTETAYANYDSAVYAFVQDDGMVGLMDIKSIESDGYTCVMDDADPSACWVSYLAIGAEEEGCIEVVTTTVVVTEEC